MYTVSLPPYYVGDVSGLENMVMPSTVPPSQIYAMTHDPTRPFRTRCSRTYKRRYPCTVRKERVDRLSDLSEEYRGSQAQRRIDDTVDDLSGFSDQLSNMASAIRTSADWCGRIRILDFIEARELAAIEVGLTLVSPHVLAKENDVSPHRTPGGHRALPRTIATID